MDSHTLSNLTLKSRVIITKYLYFEGGSEPPMVKGPMLPYVALLPALVCIINMFSKAFTNAPGTLTNISRPGDPIRVAAVLAGGLVENSTSSTI